MLLGFVDVLGQAPVVVGRRACAYVPDVAGRDAGGAVTNDDEFVTVDSDRQCPSELWVVCEEWVGVVAAVPVGLKIAFGPVVGLVQVDVLNVCRE